MHIPQLAFIYAAPLDRDRRGLFVEKGLEYPSMEEVKSTLSHWENLWSEVNTNKKLIEHLTELTGRVPERNLECFVFGAGLQVISTPFLLPIWNKAGVRWSDEKFIDLIVHELLHIFLTTNNEQYWAESTKIFAAEETITRNHILLYAMLFKIYRDAFDTEPLDFKRDNLPPGYARAVQLVRERGYEELIAEYKILS